MLVLHNYMNNNRCIHCLEPSCCAICRAIKGDKHCQKMIQAFTPKKNKIVVVADIKPIIKNNI